MVPNFSGGIISSSKRINFPSSGTACSSVPLVVFGALNPSGDANTTSGTDLNAVSEVNNS